jgi:sulfite oxidase
MAFRREFRRAAKKAFATLQAAPLPASGAAFAVAGTSVAFSETTLRANLDKPFKVTDLGKMDPDPRPDLPTIPLKEFEKHVCDETGVWVHFRGAVYDVTTFLTAHPGGASRLSMAAGKDLEPFWGVYRQHYRGHVLAFLEKYRIGNLSKKDSAQLVKDTHFDDVYEEDPPRHPDCIPCSMRPYCGETRLDLLTESYYTPNEIFYKRNHNHVPNIDPEDYELVIEAVPALGIKHHTFTLQELKDLFPKAEVVSTMQCAGNRGEDYHGLNGKPMFNAPHWNIAAISNAKYGGARMRDVLRYCGMDVDAYANGHKTAIGGKNKLGEMDNQRDWHAHFESYDCDETGDPYSGSTFLDKVVDPFGDCLICYEMNGKELPRDHGYPVRALVPGHAGARQPKWLHKIDLRPYGYPTLQCRGMPSTVDFENDLAVWPPKRGMNGINVVQGMPVQSIVCWPPQNGSVVIKDDEVEVKGVAWSGGGQGIYRVDVSIDGGKTWETCDTLHKPVVQHRRAQYGWTQFFHTCKLTAELKKQIKSGKAKLEIVSKATDSNFNVQPDDPTPHWNSRGVAVNHWYRVNCEASRSGKVVNPQEDMVKKGQFANTPSAGKFNVPWREHGWQAAPGASSQKPKDWVKYSDATNTISEPGISHNIDWNFYKSLKCNPYWEQPR